MDTKIYELHINAGKKAGIDSTCGKKIGYSTEESALKAAIAMNKKQSTRKILEGYPCAFCEKWHVGRQMSEDELLSYLEGNKE